MLDNFRRRKGARWLDVALIAHDSDPFFYGLDPMDPVMQGEYRTFVHNLGVRATLLFEASGDVCFFADRTNFTAFWRGAG